MNHHILVTEGWLLEVIKSGEKRAEFRKNDRGFSVGDIAVLVENDAYPFNYVRAKITHIVKGPDYGIPQGFCMFSFELLTT